MQVRTCEKTEAVRCPCAGCRISVLQGFSDRKVSASTCMVPQRTICDRYACTSTKQLCGPRQCAFYTPCAFPSAPAFSREFLLAASCPIGLVGMVAKLRRVPVPARTGLCACFCQSFEQKKSRCPAFCLVGIYGWNAHWRSGPVILETREARRETYWMNRRILT